MFERHKGDQLTRGPQDKVLNRANQHGVGGVVTVYMAHNRKIGSSNIVGALLIPCTCCQAEIVNKC